jgi:hypothetical protein
MNKLKTLEYGGKTLYIVKETLNYYYVSPNKDGSDSYPLGKMVYRAYHEELIE